MAFSATVAQRGLASPYDGLLQAEAAGDYALYLLLKAIVCQESAWDPAAVRPEPAIGDASYGLMQVLLGTARGLGYAGDGAGLLDPATNIHFGAAYLRQQLARYPGALSDAISAYNGGHALRLAAGGYANQAYVDAVNTYLVWYENNQPAALAPTAPTDAAGNLTDNAGNVILDPAGDPIPVADTAIVDGTVVDAGGAPILGADGAPIQAVPGGAAAGPFR